MEGDGRVGKREEKREGGRKRGRGREGSKETRASEAGMVRAREALPSGTVRVMTGTRGKGGEKGRG